MHDMRAKRQKALQWHEGGACHPAPRSVLPNPAWLRPSRYRCMQVRASRDESLTHYHCFEVMRNCAAALRHWTILKLFSAARLLCCWLAQSCWTCGTACHWLGHIYPQASASCTAATLTLLLPATPSWPPSAPQCAAASRRGRRGAAPLPLPPAVPAGPPGLPPPQPCLQEVVRAAECSKETAASELSGVASCCWGRQQGVLQSASRVPTCHVPRQAAVDAVQAAQQLGHGRLVGRRPQAVLLGHPNRAAQPISHLPAEGAITHCWDVSSTCCIQRLVAWIASCMQLDWHAIRVPIYSCPSHTSPPTHCSSGAPGICTSMAASTPRGSAPASTSA